MKSTVWYLYLAAQSDITNLSNSVCAYGGVLYSLEILPQACTVHVRSTYKFDFLSSNLCFGVLHSQKCHVMSQCYLTYTCRQSYGSDSSSLFLTRSLFFSDINRLFQLLGSGFAPYSSNAFYNILE